eukprot:SAG31_NODE_4015_length_3662_cov_4.196464_1_plen_148_part_00
MRRDRDRDACVRGDACPRARGGAAAAALGPLQAALMLLLLLGARRADGTGHGGLLSVIALAAAADGIISSKLSSEHDAESSSAGGGDALKADDENLPKASAWSPGLWPLAEGDFADPRSLRIDGHNFVCGTDYRRLLRFDDSFSNAR